MAGTFIISLDFELFWGVRDVTTLDAYGPNVRGERQAIPAMLQAFRSRGIRATWATVGFLFFGAKKELLAHLPEEKPRYDDAHLSPYPWIDRIGEDEEADPYHFGRSLVERIRDVPGQEIGTHSFSHFYALERGQTASTFRADLAAAVETGRRAGVELRSLVFPRNQVNERYLGICRDLGITSYRGSARAWPYHPYDHSPRRAVRLVDAYVDLTGPLTFRLEDAARGGPPYNLPASRFLRPYSPRLRHLEEVRLRRIERAMTHAAREGEVFHLWWHPHNFGQHLRQNVANLLRLLDHFEGLRRTYGMESASMGDLAARLAA